MLKVVRMLAVLAVMAIAGLSGATTAKAAPAPAQLRILGSQYLSLCLGNKPCADYVRSALGACRADAACSAALASFLADNPDIAAILARFEAPSAV
jgi:hypothetical protein